MTVFNVIFPIFAIALAGYGLARAGVLRPPDVAGLAAYVFNLAAPITSFRVVQSIATNSPQNTFHVAERVYYAL